MLPSNGKAMREALEQIYYLVNSLDEDCAVDPIDIRDIARAALSAPPRNCDICNTVEDATALATHLGVVDCSFGAREMAEFLLAEEKGDTNGSK